MLTQNYRPRSFQQYSQQQNQRFFSVGDDSDVGLEDLGDVNSSTPSLSSSPLSQYSAAPQSVLANFESSPAIAVPRNTELSAAVLDEISLNTVQHADLMHGDSWVLGSHLTPKSTGRVSHQRESSLSSLGSAGPASPYNPNTSNPHIAVTDSANDGCHDIHGAHEASWNYHVVPKPIAEAQDHLYAGYHVYSPMDSSRDVVYGTTPVASQRSHQDRRSVQQHAPDFAPGATRSHTGSVASSTMGGDSPATPSLGEPEDDRRRRGGKGFMDPLFNTTDLLGSTAAAFINVPKLDRTMTDIYNDELYSPNFSISSAAPSQPQLAMSPTNDLFAQRLQAANSQHLSVAHSPAPVTARDRSPFRQGSPLAPVASRDFGGVLSPSRTHFHSARQLREQSKAQEDSRALQHHIATRPEPETPKTISPKDAILEFHEPEGDSNFPLFPPDECGDFDVRDVGKPVSPSHGLVGTFRGPNATGVPDGSQFTYMPSQQAHAGIPQLPQQYPFIPQRHSSHEGRLKLAASDSSSAASVSTSVSAPKPNGTAADGGTYTCTYHGCAKRFETPAHLQRHKREGHRQAHGLNAVRTTDDSGLASSLINSQAGPHRCDRINPGTGKPCNTIFSRPYDLTRHEDTIHNARKQKVRCDLCTEDKTFSRADALTRHYRVCHPDVEFPSKHRRRGGG